MMLPRAALVFTGFAALAACQPRDYAPLIYDAKVGEAALSASYNNLTDFSAFQAAATTIRNSAVFQAQQFFWPGTSIQHFSLSNANVEYAHAVGLTGAGQTIAIIDTGFLLSHDELAGKSVTLPVANPPGGGDHGTAVAAIAASDGSSGQMIGVAPGAGLQLGSFDSFATMTEATNQAASIGAIVQNNSWGYGLSASLSNYNAVFGGASGQSYIAALQNYAQNGVVVFAASNDVSRTRIDLVAGLPQFVAGLENSFITTINASPLRNGSGQITSATLFSSACHEAARYCLIADGSVYSASGTGNSNYMLWSGTSFSAPLTSGAVAILAEAFPALSAQELRARLLASADNSWFTHVGAVNFSDTVQHGFSGTYGHGFLDLAAALLPIGGSYVPISNSASVDLGTPVIVSRGAAGNALSSGLARYQMVFADGLGGQFDVTAAALAAHGSSVEDPAGFAAERIALAAAEPVLGNGFGGWLPGRELSARTGTGEIVVMAPATQTAAETFGVSFRSDDSGGLRFGLTGLVEAGGMLGIGLGDGIGGLNSLHGAASVEFSRDLAPGVTLALGARIGVAVPAGTGGPVGFAPAAYDEFAASVSARDLARHGDRLALRLGLPQAVAAGQAQVMLPVALSATGPSFRSVGVSMVPEARQIDLGLDYARPVAEGVEMVVSAAHSINAGHIGGASDSILGIGWRMQF